MAVIQVCIVYGRLSCVRQTNRHQTIAKCCTLNTI